MGALLCPLPPPTLLLLLLFFSFPAGNYLDTKASRKFYLFDQYVMLHTLNFFLLLAPAFEARQVF